MLIADEPTTALDVTVQAQVLDLLRRLRETRDMAVLLISHDLGVIAEMADTVAVMYCGSIVETGTAEEVFRRPAHPYTAACWMRCRAWRTRARGSIRSTAAIPSPSRRPKGCLFVTRCAERRPGCAEARPPMFDYGGTQRAACWVTSGNVPSRNFQWSGHDGRLA